MYRLGAPRQAAPLLLLPVVVLLQLEPGRLQSHRPLLGAIHQLRVHQLLLFSTMLVYK